MAKEKPVTKKKSTSTKKATTARKTAASKKTHAASKKTHASSKKSTTRKLSPMLTNLTAKPSTRRPPSNPDMPEQYIEQLNDIMNEAKNLLEQYAAHLRSLDRKRLNGVGIKKQGFIDRVYNYAEENREFFPHYLTLERFRDDIDYFTSFNTMHSLSKQITELLWNIVMQSADIAYTDALEYYSSVRDAAHRRVDAAETIYLDLKSFFPRKRKNKGDPTDKDLERDLKALNSGKRDGKLVVENISPKIIGGKRKVIDETFKNNARFRKTEDGEIEE